MASMLDACRANQGLPAKLTAGSRVGYDLSKVGAGASRGFSGKKKLEAATWSGTWPAPGATLDLDFANNRGFVRGVGQGGVMDGITFTRASNGTFVGTDGLLKGGGNALGKNLLTFPQDFDNAAWVKQPNTVIPNQGIAPDGTNTADLVLGPIYQGVLGVTNAQNTKSVYMRVTSGTATVYIKDPALSLATLTCELTTEWQRFSLTEAGNASGGYHGGLWIFNVPATGILVWGAQFEFGPEATEYFPTNINVPRFDWASTEQVAGNLLAYTEQFDNSYWPVTNGSISANTSATTDPLGSNTADLYYPASSGHNRAVQRGVSVLALNIKTVSIYAKAAGINWLSIRDNTTAWAFFNLSNGTLGTVVSGYTASITDVGNGWFRCVATNTNGFVTFPTFMVSDGDNISSVTASGTNGIYLWGAQGETGTSVTAYQAVAQPTTTTPLRPTPTCNGLLIEEARTNRLLWCRDATQSNWVKTNITAAKDQTGIDGVANAASSLTATADGGTCIQTITLASGSRTSSVYLKRLTGTGTVQVSLDGTTWSTVDLSDTEWRRIVLSGTVTNPVVGIRLATSGDAVAMDFGQVEDGTFATSPILTTGASATRASDVATIPQGNWFFNGAGTIFLNFINAPSAGEYNWVAFAAQEKNFPYNIIRVVGSNWSTFPAMQIYSISGSSISTSVGAFNPLEQLRIAASYSEKELAISVNNRANSSRSSTVPDIYGEFRLIGGIGKTNINQIIFWPQPFNLDALKQLT